MAKYRDGKASFRGRENWTIRFPKLNYLFSQTGLSGFPGSGQYFYDSKLVWQPIQDTAMTKFRSSESSSTGPSSGVLLPDRATNI
jgi:hypothetical protein